MTILSEIKLTRDNVDFSTMVGREIKLITEQFPGKVLLTRVLAVRNNSLMIDRGGSNGLVDQLICRQNLEVHFVYKDQPMVFHSTVSIPREGKMEIPIVDDVSPKVRRKFIRYDYMHQLKMTTFDPAHIMNARLNKLKWMETETINIGGGGMLVKTPNLLSRENFIVFNITLENMEFPKLMVGRVRHCTNARRQLSGQAGIEFIIKEEISNILTPTIIRSLSSTLFQFDAVIQRNLISHFEKIYRNNQI